jgi:hypothetical protein
MHGLFKNITPFMEKQSHLTNPADFTPSTFLIATQLYLEKDSTSLSLINKTA